MNPNHADDVRPYRSFLLAFVGTSAALLSGMAALNVVVDPYTSWNSRVFPGVWDFATSRVGKGEIFHAYSGETALVGNSRVMLGIRGGAEGSPAGDDAEVPCNLGIAGASYGELQEILRCCLDRPNIRRILFFVDFQTFREEYQFNESFSLSRFNPAKAPFDHLCDLVWNYHTSQDSFEKLGMVVRGIPADFTATACPIPERQCAKESFAVRTEKIIRNVTAERGFQYSPATVEKLRELIRHCRQQNVELVLAINPTHATFLETYWQGGTWTEYQRWARHLTRVVQEEGEGAVALWDFNGFHQYTTESLTDANGKAVTGVEWFWEPSHYTCALGDRMLQRISGAPGADPNFGIRLTPETVEGQLATMEAGHDLWATRHAGEVQLVQQIAATGRIGFLQQATHAEVQTAAAPAAEETVIR